MHSRRSAVVQEPTLQPAPVSPADDNEAQSGCSEKRTRQQLAFDPVLDRVEDHERQNEPEQEQQERPGQGMPQTSLHRLAEPNHGSMVVERRRTGKGLRRIEAYGAPCSGGCEPLEPCSVAVKPHLAERRAHWAAAE